MRGRKVTPKVRDGKVQKKNRHQWTEFQELLDQETFSTIKMKPQEGYIHVVDRKSALKFVKLIPDWEDMSKGLSALVPDIDGCNHQTDMNYYPNSYNSIWLSPFPKDMTLYWPKEFGEGHKEVTDLLGIEQEEIDDEEIKTVWTKPKAQAWQLLHLFLYDLYCHHECMLQGKDNYHHSDKLAEEYAIKTSAIILPDYEKVVGRFY
ncbi:hypothetical protein EYS14_13790 [Alteromonadaceae bacterium M269]|nr:hypothetical protein EYS14_13790 [Alteromonadaceae bacterium M269]